ncbi:hypothetical protein PMV_100 [Port-miou virus]|uniref:Uncharacterized protein n=1 Tax=Port-miou virus TaxID=1733873 RepID=A0A0N9PU99_9VIRU|nr:hypothetical protein PMV_100 [Port-miou virus]
MYVNIPTLLDICAYNIVEKSIDFEDIIGQERAKDRILQFHHLLRFGGQTAEGRAGLSLMRYLMGKGSQDYIEEIDRAFLLLGAFAGVVDEAISEKISQAMPPTFLLKKLQKESREVIISFYLFSCLPLDFEKLEFLCKMRD